MFKDAISLFYYKASQSIKNRFDIVIIFDNIH